MPFSTEAYMKVAIEQAKRSLREGSNGFGTLIIKDEKIIAHAHDREETERDPTAHAEIQVIQKASKMLGENLDGCIFIGTHEPCPMCATAIVRANIHHIVFGYSVADALRQGHTRRDIPCEEIFARVGKAVKIEKGILRDECALLYHKDVRQEIGKLRNATDAQLTQYNDESAQKRVRWFQSESALHDVPFDDPKDKGYHVLLQRFQIAEEQAPIVQRDAKTLVFHSANFCPTLEACKILELDTRHVCKLYNEGSTEMLIEQIDPRLRFARNYQRLRPYTNYCEEMIVSEE